MISYICDRERAIVWGTEGGLPSMPQGLWLQRAGSDKRDWLGSMFSDVPIGSGDVFSRPTAGGGGLGDPLERDPEAVMRDVEDDYVSIGRAKRDYGVVLEIVDADLAQYSIDLEATRAERARIAGARRGWLKEDPEQVARRYREGELNQLDLVRRYGVIVDWGSGELLPKTTAQFREMMQRRSASHWNGAPAA